jgi:hypothetical protein
LSRERGQQEERDQGFVNLALYGFGVKWPRLDIENRSIDGVCRNGLKVTVLSLTDICRQKCKDFSMGDSRESIPYVWHSSGKHSGEGKKAAASKVGTWYLKEEWDLVGNTNSPKGLEWLKSVSKAIL